MGDPTTDREISGEHLIVASDALDAHIQSLPDLPSLATLVYTLQRQQQQLRRGRWINLMMAVVACTVGVVGLALALRVDRNTRQFNIASEKLERTNAAIVVFCTQTNIDNARARVKFVERFGANTPPEQKQQFEDFVDVLFPQRECGVDADATTP